VYIAKLDKTYRTSEGCSATKKATDKESIISSPVGQLMKKTAFLNELSGAPGYFGFPLKEADIQLQP
jgi:hypothetical protein